jgi:hypothetical protein
MKNKQEKATRQIPAGMQPGCTVTGIYIHTDRSQGMVVLQLLKGAQGRMSIYEMSDDLLQRLIPGLPVSGAVDRVEFDSHDNMTVILKGESFQQLC